MISWFRFVVHAEVARYEREGWTVVAHLGPVHGTYAVLMRWAGTGEPAVLATRDAEHRHARA